MFRVYLSKNLSCNILNKYDKETPSIDSGYERDQHLWYITILNTKGL